MSCFIFFSFSLSLSPLLALSRSPPPLSLSPAVSHAPSLSLASWARVCVCVCVSRIICICYQLFIPLGFEAYRQVCTSPRANHTQTHAESFFFSISPVLFAHARAYKLIDDSFRLTEPLCACDYKNVMREGKKMGEETGEGEEQDEEGEEYKARKEDTHTRARAHTAPLSNQNKKRCLKFCTG